MVAGFDRYFQIARCFRDEDQRADRQLEFTQVDLEMSFVGVEDVLAVLEELTVRALRARPAGVELPRPFPRISYAEAMARYGSDKPDTRIQLELVDLTDALPRAAASAPSARRCERGGVVKCLPIHDADALSRGEIDRLEAFVKKELGAQGLAWVRVGADGAWQSPIAKFLSDAERAAIAARDRRAPGQRCCFFQADEAGARQRDPRRGCASTSAAASAASTAAPGTPLFVRRLPALRARRATASSPTCTALRRAARGGSPAARDAIPSGCAARTTTW